MATRSRNHGRANLAVAAFAVALGVAAGTPAAAHAQRPLAHHGPDGFRNLEPTSHGPLGVALPFFARRVWSNIAGRDGGAAGVPVDGRFLHENARHSVPTATWIGHSTVLVQMDGVTFLTDPIWSDTAGPAPYLGARRLVPPALPLDALPPIDFVVVSHAHYDHADLPTLRALAARGARVFVPLRLGRVLRDAGIDGVTELDWWQSAAVDEVTVHCVPARHWSRRGLFDENDTLWSGWAVTGPTRRFYFAGDTGRFAGFAEIGARLGPFGLAALPIGAYEPAAMMRAVHLDPEEAVAAALEVKAERALGVHWGTFDLTDEPLDEPRRRFAAEVARRGLAAARYGTAPLGAIERW
jgi:N-acyl-phosphatidylethanolamine-hydrolysing phospholipase D